MNEIGDDYIHIESNIYYIEENIPCNIKEHDLESSRINLDYNSQQTVHCNCTNLCTKEGMCKCSLNREPNYEISAFGLVATDVLLKTDRPIIECNESCSCNLKCSNRLVQFGPRKSLKIAFCVEDSTDSKGLGLFTECLIPKGGFICEYAGEVISKAEAMERTALNKCNNRMNYIICVNEHSRTNKIQTFIDPSEFGNIGRYLNHSCEPNCVMIPIRVNNPLPKLCFFAIDNIESHAELTFDYGSKGNESFSNSNLENRIQCLCKSKRCRKWLPNETFD